MALTPKERSHHNLENIAICSESNGKPLSGMHLVIMSQQRLQSSLLATHIAEKTGAGCEIPEHLADAFMTHERQPEKCVFLWDARSYPLEMLNEKVKRAYLEHASHGIIYNAYPGFKVDPLIEHGVIGIFYQDQDPDLFVKGLMAIFQGDLWFPRDILNTYILAHQKKPPKGSLVSNVSLTDRETEILLMIVSGETNSQIARSLYISTHTVKTHVSNILRKIKVRNRTAAANWARKELGYSNKN